LFVNYRYRKECLDNTIFEEFFCITVPASYFTIKFKMSFPLFSYKPTTTKKSKTNRVVLFWLFRKKNQLTVMNTMLKFLFILAVQLKVFMWNHRFYSWQLCALLLYKINEITNKTNKNAKMFVISLILYVNSLSK
jgi:hypothetical protein